MPSKLGHILNDMPGLKDYSLAEGEFVPYKGRSYCWLKVSPEGQLQLTRPMLDRLAVTPGDELMCIRSSDIAFMLAHHGPLLERAKNYQGDIPVY